MLNNITGGFSQPLTLAIFFTLVVLRTLPFAYRQVRLRGKAKHNSKTIYPDVRLGMNGEYAI